MGDPTRSLDSSVVDGLHAGDPEALGAVYEAYAEEIYGLAYSLTGSIVEAQDTVQDVFLGLSQALDVYEEMGKFGSWLKKVAIRTVLMRMRASGCRQEAPLFLATKNSRADSEETQLLNRLLIERALARMPPSLRVVFVLKEIEGYSHSEVAERLGISEGASTARLHRARKFLRAQVV